MVFYPGETRDGQYMFGVDNFVELVDMVLKKTSRGVAKLFLLYIIGWELWLTCNALMFQGEDL